MSAMNTDNEQKSLDGTGASIEQDLGGHPLFPRPETEYGPDPRKFDNIHIHRWLPDGTKESCPKVWKGSQLRSLEQVVDMYGGECTYRFIAQCGKTHRFQAYSDMIPVAGPARKPFHNETKRVGETPAPAQQPQPQPQQAGLDMTMLFKFMLEREAHASERQAEREMRTAENQTRMQEMFMRMALDRPAPPNPYEGMREMMQLMQTMNNQQTQAATPKDSDSVKMLERGIAMGKEMVGSEGGGDEIPWGAVISAAATGLSLLKKSKSKEEKEQESSKSSKQKESAPSSSKKSSE